MKLKGLFVANLVLISFAVTVPIAHVFALPQRFELDADLWFRAVGYFDQVWRVYAGSIALAALFISLMLFVRQRKTTSASLLSLNGAFVYAALSGLIFLSDASAQGYFTAFGLAVLGWLVLLSASLVILNPRRLLRPD